MNEWSFITAHPNGEIISIDGKVQETTLKVRDLCTGEGWDIDHAAIDSGPDYALWRLILSRPFAQARPTASNLDDAVMIGAA